MMKRSTLGGGALIALALLFVGLTILFDHALHGWRVDLTQNRLYSTAPGTDRILKSLREPVNLYFFFTEKTASQLPVLKTYGGRVREFLQELAARSNGKILLHFVDPQPFSEDEDRAAELGVHGTATGASGGQLYFGLAGTNSTDGHAAIEFFDPAKEAFLEYDVVKLIHELANPKKPVLGWLTSLPMTSTVDPQSGQMREPWVIYTQAQQLFNDCARSSRPPPRSMPTSTCLSSCIRKIFPPRRSTRSINTRSPAGTLPSSSTRSPRRTPLELIRRTRCRP